MTRLLLTLAFALLVGSTAPGRAQTVSYADAIDHLSVACAKDIEKYCKTAHVGGGGMQRCLTQNPTSAQCRSAGQRMQALLNQRADARASITRVCDVDARRFCAGIQAGDGNLMECFYKVRRNVSAQCQRAIADAGYD